MNGKKYLVAFCLKAFQMNVGYSTIRYSILHRTLGR